MDGLGHKSASVFFMFEFQKFLTITKVDDEARMVYGWASTDDIDSDGEIIEAQALEKALPNYLQYPTIREMHQPKVAGTTKNAEITSKNGKSGLYIGAKVVTDDAWKLVKEGVYRGFSIGGEVVRRSGNIIKELILTEISLVDVPANKSAKIEIWKRDKTVLITKMNESLDRITFTENPVAEELLKGVKKHMLKKSEELKNNEEVVTENTEVVETVENTEETKVEATEEVVQETTEEVVEVKEASDESVMTKIDEAMSKIDAIEKKEEVIQPNETLQKSLTKMSELLVKVSNKVVDLETRLARVEQTPAETKSKTVNVFKSLVTEDEKPVEKSNPNKEKIMAKRNRLAELSTKRDSMSANEFAKEGHALEISKLYSELDQLMA